MGREKQESETYLTHQSALCEAFDADISAGTRAASRTMDDCIITRSPAPYKTQATSFLIDAIETSFPQTGDYSGLKVDDPRMWSASNSCILQTPAMVERNRYLIVFDDLSCIYAVRPDKVALTSYVLPIPITLRRTSQLAGTKSSDMIIVRTSIGGPERLTLLMVGLPLVNKMNQFHGDSTGFTSAWTRQLDAEIDYLDARLKPIHYALNNAAQLLDYDGSLTNAAGPFRHVLKSSLEGQATFFFRTHVTDDCAHLGHITFLPCDPMLEALAQAIEIAAIITYNENKAPREVQYATRLMAGGVTYDRTQIVVVTHPKSDSRDIAARITALVGQDGMTLAERFSGLPMGEMQRAAIGDDLAILRLMTPSHQSSAHELMGLHAELAALKLRFAEELERQEKIT